MQAKPRDVLSVYDNPQAGIDRYTVVLNPRAGWDRQRGGLYQCIGLSSSPSHPQGVSQFTSCQVGRHLGKKVPWAKLPSNIRAHVNGRLK